MKKKTKNRVAGAAFVIASSVVLIFNTQGNNSRQHMDKVPKKDIGTLPDTIHITEDSVWVEKDENIETEFSKGVEVETDKKRRKRTERP